MDTVTIECATYWQGWIGMDKEGIFRKSPSSEELRSVKKAYNQGITIRLNRSSNRSYCLCFRTRSRSLPI